MNSPYALVGPVLPQALRLARYQSVASLPEDVSAIVSENDVINRSPSREEERLLATNAAVIIALENLFSWTEKDRTSRTSRLSIVESVRFQRAMYRIWLVSVLFGRRRLDSSTEDEDSADEEDEEDEEDESNSEDLDQNWEDQKSFLEQFSSEELTQIHKLSHFLWDVGDMALYAEERGMDGASDTYDSIEGMFLLAGPHTTLRCYEDATSKYLPLDYQDDEDVYEGFLTDALDAILKARHTETSLGDYVGTILDDIHGEHVLCHHCHDPSHVGVYPGTPTLASLYNETNWECLKGESLQRIILLPGSLAENLTETALRKALTGDWSRLLHQLFPCKSEAYSTWSKQDWICAGCWSDFICDTIWRWGLKQKRRALETIKKNCKYGYNCRKQCDDSGLAHAEQFNHLCEPKAVAAC